MKSTMMTLAFFGFCMTFSGCGEKSAEITASWQGTKQLGVATQETYAYGVATDSSGNVFVAGHTAGGLDGNTLTGSYDLFVSKYNSIGVRQWTKQLGVATKESYAQGVTTDPSGNVFVTGRTSGGLDGNSLTGTSDFLVTKYNGSGVKQWTKLLGVASGGTFAYGVTTDASGNVFVAGNTDGALDGNSLTGVFDVFVSKYNSSGVKQWTKLLGVALKVTKAYGVATDASGNVFVAGYTTGGLDGNTLTGTSDFFVTKYNSSGAKQWTKQLGVASQETHAQGVTTDASGNVFVAGYTTGGLDGNTLTGSDDLFVTKYNNSGTKQWTKQLGVGSQETHAQGITTDASGNVFMAGYTTGGLDGNTLTGSNDLFVTKYNNSGTKQWMKQLGVASAETRAESATTDSSGNVFVAGWTSGGLDGNTLTGSDDLFVTKYNGSGVKQ